MRLKSSLIAFGCGISFLCAGVALAGASQKNSANDAQIAAQKDAFHAYQKPGAAVRFTHDLAGPVAPGAIGAVRINLSDEYQSGVVKVSIVETPGLTILSDIRDMEFMMNGAQTNSFDIQFAAKSEGRQFLNFITTVELENGQVLKRANSVPVYVGGKTAFEKSSQPKMQAAKPSGGVVVMRAQETIRTE